MSTNTEGWLIIAAYLCVGWCIGRQGHQRFEWLFMFLWPYIVGPFLIFYALGQTPPLKNPFRRRS